MNDKRNLEEVINELVMEIVKDLKIIRILDWFNKKINNLMLFFLRSWKYGERQKIRAYLILGILKAGMRFYNDFREKEIGRDKINNDYIGFKIIF